MALIKATWGDTRAAQCGKRCFNSFAEASADMESVVSRVRGFDGPMRPSAYFCDFCRSHHWGRRYRGCRKASLRPGIDA